MRLNSDNCAHENVETGVYAALRKGKRLGDAERAVSVSMETEDGTALKYRRTDRHEGKCRRVSGNASSRFNSGRTAL